MIRKNNRLPEMIINKIIKIFLLLSVVFVLPILVFSQSWTINSNQWAATDALGRKLPGFSDVGDEKSEKLVGMFYWTWHQDGPGNQEPHNLTELLAQYDGATVEAMMNDFNHPNWKGINQFHWDEPLFGYYRSTDDWVLRKHAEMLADAGVDVVFFDCTNGSFTWRDSYTKLLKVWSQARLDGVKTPYIAFILPFGANENAMNSIEELYTDLYQPGLYQDLWFMWNDKPLIMAYPESIVPRQGNTAGFKFNANQPFYSVNVRCPSYANNIGNLTFKLFAWSNNYNESVNGTPLAEKTFVNFRDNQWLLLSFDKLPAGEYVWELSNGTEDVGVWKWTDSQSPAISYYNGEQVSGHYTSEIAYNPNFNFTPLSSGTTHIPIQLKGKTISMYDVNTMKKFFTFRPAQPGYVSGPTRNDHWGWLEVYPQNGFPLNPQQGYEQVCVSIAQNASINSGGQCTSFNGPKTFGRNYIGNADLSKGYWDNSDEAWLKGANFTQQWERAFELDPKLVWVTGWNEWIFGRFENWVGCFGGSQVATSFPDNFDKYRSRDIEPAKSWGSKGDVYYIQLADNIRKFKGMQKQNAVSAPKTIDINNIASWSDIEPHYRSYKGNTMHRNHAGHGSKLTYTNTTGRNDIVASKVSRDTDFVYFYVETDNNLTDKSDPKWMRLFIDIDRDKSTGWEGYDFILNRNSPGDSVIVEKNINGWLWEKSGSAEYKINTKSLVLKVPFSCLGLTAGSRLNFEFKWSDNMQEDGNIMDFYVNGDVAPGGRFNYIYNVEKSNDGYFFASDPQGTNQGLKCELYVGSFDTIPQFNRLKESEVNYISSVQIPESSTTDFALNYRGFFEADVKDEFAFSLDADSLARLYINGMLVVESNSIVGEKTGTVKLMPGKHELQIEYVTGQINSPKLIVQVQSSTFNKSLIPGTMLSKYNAKPQVEISYFADQNYFSEIDTVAIGMASDQDGNIIKIEVFNDKNLVAESNSDEIILKNLNPGNYSISANAIDNDGGMARSNTLNFEVRPAFAVPGVIKVEEFRKGSNVVILKDDIYEYRIRANHGKADYPIAVGQSGTYLFTFSVRTTTNTGIIKIKNKDVELAKLNVTGKTTEWVDFDIQVDLMEGIQVLEFEFEGRVVLGKIDISSATGVKSFDKGLIQVYPNPSSGDFQVHSAYPVESIRVYDVIGKMVNEIVVDKNQFTRISGSGIAPGIYFLHVCLADETKEVIKIVKN